MPQPPDHRNKRRPGIARDRWKSRWCAWHRACYRISLLFKEGEVPFDTDRKRLSTLCRTPAGLYLYTKGAQRNGTTLCSRVQIGAKTLPLTPELREKFAAAQEALAEKGLRVLAFACRTVRKKSRRGTQNTT